MRYRGPCILKIRLIPRVLQPRQRIGMARLFYQRPSFAVLDECTSAVSVDVEKDLYQSAREENITCITLSQRPAPSARTVEFDFSQRVWNARA